MSKNEGVSFGSSQDRMSKKEVFGARLVEGLPGPGGYDPGQYKVNRANVGVKTSALRFGDDELASTLPGPGQYDTRGKSLMKPTFNVALNRRPEKFQPRKSASVSPPRR